MSKYKMTQQEFGNKYKDKLRETFKVVVEFLNTNDIQWWAAGGTAIGAVRHHDIIPWDDDIDIYVLRKDYNKLLTLESELANYELALKCAQNDEEYGKVFAKIYNKKTSVWEKKNIPVVYGLWIDVFPLDFASGSKEECYLKYLNYQEVALKYIWSAQHIPIASIFLSLLNKDFKLAWRKIVNKYYLYKKRSKFYHEWLNKDKMIQQDNGDYLVCYTGGCGKKEIFPQEWFKEYVEFPFSDYTVRLSAKYDDFLTQFYGNYMNPPSPIPVLTHRMYYVNLERNLTKDEILEKIMQDNCKLNDFERYDGETSILKEFKLRLLKKRYE